MLIGELAKKAGVSRDTIRYYERMGIVKGVSQPHPDNNYKEYEPENVKRILMVKNMKEMGITLRESMELQEAIENDGFNTQSKNEFMHRKLAEVEAKIQELKKMQKLLKHVLSQKCPGEE